MILTLAHIAMDAICGAVSLALLALFALAIIAGRFA